jgi:hypothetical protein
VAWCSDPDFRGLFAPFNRGYLSRSYDDTLFTVLPEVGHTVGLGRAQPIDCVALFAEDENRAPEGKGGGINRPGITRVMQSFRAPSFHAAHPGRDQATGIDCPQSSVTFD